jgi:acetylornithine/succinyldiaminopimelate/putrescine aminotransferase
VTANGNFRAGFGNLLPDTEFVKFDDLEDLETKLKRGDVAAFIAEPVQGKGVKFPEDEYFRKAISLCHQYGALFIADEVQTGLGRTGRLFAYMHWGVKPDILTVAKALSGGYVPAAAFVTRRDIYQKVYSSLDRCVVHSTTFGRNNLAMACGLATLDILDEEDLVSNAAIRGGQLLERLRDLQAKHDIIKEVRGKGLMLAIEFHEPSSLKLKLAWKAIHTVDKGLFAQMIVTPLLQNHRILSQVAGHHMDVVKILPPTPSGKRKSSDSSTRSTTPSKASPNFPDPYGISAPTLSRPPSPPATARNKPWANAHHILLIVAGESFPRRG